MPVNNLDIIRVVAGMRFQLSDIIQNTYHFQFIGEGGVPDDWVYGALSQQLDAAYAEIIGMMSGEIAFTDISVWNVTQDRPMITLAWPTLIAGTQSTQSLPNQVSALVLFRTMTARSQGRKYLPPFVEEQSASGGFLQSTAIAAVGDFAGVIETAVNAVEGMLYPGNWRYPTGPFSRWVSHTVSPVYHTQRRRVVGVGS